MYRNYALIFNAEDAEYRIIYTDIDDLGIWYIDCDVPPFTIKAMAEKMLNALRSV